MSRRRARVGPGTGIALALAAVGAVALAWWLARGASEPVVVRSEPSGVMGTSSSILAVLPADRGRDGEAVLRAAEGELRRLEGLFSTWIEASEISLLNLAKAGREVSLSDDSRQLLDLARQLHAATAGAFDVTARPLIEGWRRAGKESRLPSREELEALRGSSSWEDFELTARGARKARASARLDVDGVAKGLAIDRAVDAMKRAGAIGGMVEVGGDLRVFGAAPPGGGWPVGIRSPSAEEVLGEIEITDRAVCTSGGYARYVEIAGARYSHIIDPRTGRPAADVVSATVVAIDAATADAWATALSVLGEPGLAGLPDGAEALLLFANPADRGAVATAGFPPIAGDVGLEKSGG